MKADHHGAGRLGIFGNKTDKPADDASLREIPIPRNPKRKRRTSRVESRGPWERR